MIHSIHAQQYLSIQNTVDTEQYILIYINILWHITVQFETVQYKLMHNTPF